MILIIFILQIFLTLSKKQRGVIEGIDLQNAFNTQFCNSCKHCDFNIDSIANLTGYNISKNPILNNTMKIDRFLYLIDEVNHTFSINNKKIPSVSSYLMVYPKVGLKQLKGLITYFHPTVFDKQNVPSSKNNYYLGIAGFYASLGFAILMIDQIGLGDDWQKIHPYVLFPEVHALTMSLAMNQVIDQLFTWYRMSQIGVLPVGYSQGAGYALWFRYCWEKGCQGFQNPTSKYKYYSVAGLEGAYDVNNTILPFLIQNVEKDNHNKFNIQSQIITAYLKPGLATMAVVSYNQYCKSSVMLRLFMNYSYYDMNCTQIALSQQLCDASYNNHLNIQDALKARSLEEQHFAFSFGASAFTKKLGVHQYTAWQTWGVNHRNSILAFVRQQFTQRTQFKETLVKASITLKDYRWNNTFLFSLKYDSLVSPNNTINMVTSNPNIRYQYFDNTKYQSCLTGLAHPVDHIRAQYLAHIYVGKNFGFF